MTDQLWQSAARNYRAAGLREEAARCYRNGGDLRNAVDLYADLGLHHLAAEALMEGNNAVGAAWRLAHFAHDAPAARRIIADHPDEAVLLDRLVLARCDLLEGRPDTSALAVLTEVQNALDDTTETSLATADSAARIESWAILLAEQMHRFDLVALVFAAAVRGGRPNAADRWQKWARATFGMTIVIPDRAQTMRTVFGSARRWG